MTYDIYWSRQLWILRQIIWVVFHQIPCGPDNKIYLGNVWWRKDVEPYCYTKSRGPHYMNKCLADSKKWLKTTLYCWPLISKTSKFHDKPALYIGNFAELKSILKISTFWLWTLILSIIHKRFSQISSRF